MELLINCSQERKSNQMEPTTKEALELIGQGLAHASLKLSQSEHLNLMKAYSIIKRIVDAESSPKSEKQLTDTTALHQ